MTLMTTLLLLLPMEHPFHLVGEAQLADNRLRLTPAQNDAVGAAWFRRKQQVSAGFEVAFRFQLTDQGGLGPGADGFAFVLQNEGPNAMAGRGSAGGFALGDGQGDRSKPGIPRSLAVFFDAFQNEDARDPSDNYIAVCTNGPMGKMKWPPNRLGMAKKLNIRMKDGAVHTARIEYRPPVLSVSLDDGPPVIQLPVDVRTVTDGAGAAYVGFTASTGGGFQNHDIFDWEFRPEITSDLYTVQSEIRYFTMGCVDGKNLCTPPEAMVEERNPGVFHIVLPAHLEWGAHIPNSAGRRVVITNAQGSACWGSDFQASCGGPGGVAAAAGARLDPNHPIGALITKSERGRTWFSLNGLKGRGFRDNQGFYEFDVRIE